MHTTHSPITHADECAPPCGGCGGVECFERPRFFAGQLLTDKDLNAEQRYVVEKNKLHNRFLYGSGVVCGLGVRCGQCCDCCVVVEPGYAIDCCGNDVVVCEPTSFDVCAFIDQCFCRRDPCLQTRPKAEDCDDRQPRQYLLVLWYDETPADPITAFGTNRCGCGEKSGGCQCGGKAHVGTGGCGCGGKRGSKADCGCGCGGHEPTPPGPGRCEPSRIREGFRLTLVPVKERAVKPVSFADRLAAQALFTQQWATVAGPTIGTQPQPDFTRTLARLVAQRDLLLNVIDTRPLNRCGLRKKLLSVPLPESPAAGWEVLAGNATKAFADIRTDIDRGLIADVLLDVCPACDEDEDGVVLASILVQDRRVIGVNNLARQIILTPRMLREMVRSVSAPIWDHLTAYTLQGSPMALHPDTLAMRSAATPSAAASTANTVGGRLATLTSALGGWLLDHVQRVLPTTTVTRSPVTPRRPPNRGGNP